MPSKLKQLSGKELVNFFEKFGFEIRSQNGSHVKMKNISGRILVVPNHSTINKGTLKAIYNQALTLVNEDDLSEFFYTE